MMKRVLSVVVLMSAFGAFAGEVKDGKMTCVRQMPGLEFDFACWASDGLKDGEGAVYVFLEWDAKGVVPVLQPLMANGTIPPGICVTFNSGKLAAPAGASDRGMRASTFDQPGTEFPSAIADEVVPAAERLLGVRASRSPDLHFIAGASSGGIAAWNACWYRNDWFRRCYCNSPTFSNMRGGNQLMPLVRKCETRPIRAYLTAGTFEPDYFFGDSYFVAEDAVGALRFAGYEVRYNRFPHAPHGAKWGEPIFLGQVLTWLFEDWKTKPVTVATNPIRVRNAVVKGNGWRVCNFAMPAPVTEVRSSDRWRVYSVSPTNRFVMTERMKDDGTRDQLNRLAPLELAWNATRVGGTALALAADDRLWVATELGVQGVVSFGITDAVLPLPGDLPCDNVALVGTNLYASSGERVFHRYVKTGAADPTKVQPPRTPGYMDDFWYSREHEPAGGMAELLGSYVIAGRVAGVASVLSDAEYHEQFDCAGWADRSAGHKGLMTPDSLFSAASMTKTFMGVALMCAIDEGKLSLDDEAVKHLLGFQPGETFSFSNAWVSAAAACLEAAVGEPYEKYLQRKILDPLGMEDTTFRPNGGLFSTPRDMIRFSQMLAHHGAWKDKTVVSRKTFDTVFAAKQTPAGIKAPYSDGGWICDDWSGREGAMRAEQCANLRTGHSRVFFIQTENAAGSAFLQLKRDWHFEADKIQGTAPPVFRK